MLNGSKGRARHVSRMEQGGLSARRRHFLEAIGECVYVARYPDGTIKIGHTTNARNRIQSLGLGTHSLLALIPSGTRAEEQAIHARLAGHAIKGREWYSPDDPAVLAVVNELRGEIGLSPL